MLTVRVSIVFRRSARFRIRDRVSIRVSVRFRVMVQHTQIDKCDTPHKQIKK